MKSSRTLQFALLVIILLGSMNFAQTSADVPALMVLTDEKGDVDFPSFDIINASYILAANISSFSIEFVEDPVINASTDYNLEMHMYDASEDKFADLKITVDGNNNPVAKFSWNLNTSSPQSDQAKVNTTIGSHHLHLRFRYDKATLVTNFVSYDSQAYFEYEFVASINTAEVSLTDTLSFDSRTDTNTEPLFDIPFPISIFYISFIVIVLFQQQFRRRYSSIK